MKKFTHLTFYSENIYTSPEHTSCSKHHGSPLLEAKQKKMGSGWSNANTHTSIINLVHTVNKGSWRLINHNYSTLLSWFWFTQYTLLSWFWYTQYTLLPWTWFTQYTLLSWFWFTQYTLLPWTWFTQYTLLSWFWFTQHTLLPWTWFT